MSRCSVKDQSLAIRIDDRQPLAKELMFGVVLVRGKTYTALGYMARWQQSEV